MCRDRNTYNTYCTLPFIYGEGLVHGWKQHLACSQAIHMIILIFTFNPSNIKFTKKWFIHYLQLEMCATKQFSTMTLFHFQHRDTADNNPDTPFEFTADNLKVCGMFHQGSSIQLNVID